MRRLIVAVALVLVGAVLGSLWTEPVRAGKPCTIPKEWGALKAVAAFPNGMSIFAFEAADGTVRTTPANCKTPAQAVDTISRE
jgi:hypothetical protein